MSEQGNSKREDNIKRSQKIDSLLDEILDLGEDLPDVPPSEKFSRVPGTHFVPNEKHPELVGNHDFCLDVRVNLPNKLLYRRAESLVQSIGTKGNKKLKVVDTDNMRILIDRNMKLIKWDLIAKKKVRTYQPCTKDLAGVAISELSQSPTIDEVKLFTNYPIYIRGWERARPGYHNGVYYDEPEALQDIKPKFDRAVLDDLLIDFPFAEEGDRQNYIGLLLTPLIRPALNGNVPLFLIKSSLPRTGKTKLAEQVTGGLYLGTEAPAMQWSKSEEERDKRLLALLRQGDTIIHLDNIAQYVDSPALASLVTSKYYQGRILGKSNMVKVENNMIIIATGNNPRASREIIRRSIPITLQPKSDHPELRNDFVHPFCFDYVIENRSKIMSCLLGMVENWKATGRAKGKLSMGGFEDWASTVSGIMYVNGYEKFMTNWVKWVEASDPETEDLHSFVKIWEQELSAGVAHHARELLEIVEQNDLFGHALSYAKSEQSKLTLFSTRILSQYMNAPVGDFIIRRSPNRLYYLEEINGNRRDSSLFDKGKE